MNWTLLCFFILITPGVISSPLTTNEKQVSARINEFDIGLFKYVGAFRFPAAELGASRMAYTQGTFTLSSDNKSLYIVGHVHHQAVGEFLIPKIVDSKNLNSLQIAKVLQPFSTILNRAASGNIEGIDKITGMQEINEQLIINGVRYYDAVAKVTDTTLILRNPKQLAVSKVDGFFKLKGAAHAAGWISAIPRQWQKSIGAKWLTGFASNYAINARSSIGPTAFGFYPLALLDSNEESGIIISETLLDYSLSHPLHEDRYNKLGKNNLWTEVSSANYGFIVPGTSYYLVVGNSGGHTSGIGYKITQDSGNLCGGPCPYKKLDNYNYFWVWDVNGLTDVKLGKKKPHELKPFQYGVFDQSRANWLISGADFDEQNKLLYVLYTGIDDTQSKYENGPLMLVYHLDVK